MAVPLPHPRHAFELTGGNLALDLANTKERRPTPAPVEFLHTYPDLVSWAVQARALGAAQGKALLALAGRRRDGARKALARALDLREALFAAGSALAGGRAVPPGALGRINQALSGALVRLRLSPAGRAGAAAWTWASEPHLDRPWWPAARAGAELLASEEVGRLRECGARDCAWLVLDTSRNGSRRWCSMTVCGNREKARRFRRRAPRSRPG